MNSQGGRRSAHTAQYGAMCATRKDMWPGIAKRVVEAQEQ